MSDIDCPHGETIIPDENERLYGVCAKDLKTCWNKMCSLGAWQDRDRDRDIQITEEEEIDG